MDGRLSIYLASYNRCIASFRRLTCLLVSPDYDELELLIILLSLHSCNVSAMIFLSTIVVQYGLDWTGALPGPSGMSICNTSVHSSSPRFFTKVFVINLDQLCRFRFLNPLPKHLYQLTLWACMLLHCCSLTGYTLGYLPVRSGLHASLKLSKR